MSRHRVNRRSIVGIDMLIGAMLAIAGGVGTLTGAALMERTDLSAAPDWYCYAAVEGWECSSTEIKGRVPQYVGPESGIQPALDEATGAFNPDASLDTTQVEGR